MSVDPPYRLDPLQNPVDVKWEEDGDGGGEPGNENCWGFFQSLLIQPDISPTLRWGRCGTEGGFTTSPGEAAGSCGFDHWYVGADNVIVCFEYQWLVGIDCGFAPGPNDSPPEDPPPDWEGHNHSPNSEE